MSAFRGNADIAPFATISVSAVPHGRLVVRRNQMMSCLARSLRANVAGSAWIFEAADGFRKHLLRQAEHDLRKKDYERDCNQVSLVTSTSGNSASPPGCAMRCTAVSSFLALRLRQSGQGKQIIINNRPESAMASCWRCMSANTALRGPPPSPPSCLAQRHRPEVAMLTP